MIDVQEEATASNAPPSPATAKRSRIPLKRVAIGQYNPRRGRKAIEEMADSIRAQGGVMQAPLVRPKGHDEQGPLFELVYGQRRFLGAKLVYGDDGVIDFDCREMTDEEAIAASAAENLDRKDMSPIEEAEAAAKILAEFDGDRASAAKRMGWSLSTLESRLKLMACSQAVRDAVVEEKIALGVAEVLAGLRKEQQDELLSSTLAAEKQPTIEELKAQVLVHTKNLDAAIFDKAQCAACPHNSAIQGTLFGTFAGGHCLNSVCFDEKLEAELQQRADGLRDTYPVVRIVRAGDQLSVRKIFVEGPAGVGEEQAMACRSCANFGAAVSSIPEKLGLISRNLCFSPSCNDEKIEAHRQAQEALAAQAASAALQNAAQSAASATGAADESGSDTDPDAEAPAGGGAQAPSAAKAPAKPASKPSALPTVRLTPTIAEHKRALYRTVIAREVLKAPHRGNTLLLALAATGKLSTIPSSEVSTVLASLIGAGGDAPKREATRIFSVGKTFSQARAIEPDVLSSCLPRIAATCVSGLEAQDLEDLVHALAPDWKEHFRLDAEFLGKLTKSEILGIASELGIAKRLGDKANGLLAEKKDKLIATVLGVNGFEYQGAIPRILLPGSGRGAK